ncbi:helix-turn-helix domain-containing protein [Cohnella terricola]|uniref:Helix-turn-helix domain-containing protein n=1 Tax=Cohnella terricola TaxID=1289167 RepID=A0A559JMY4_9BACL|nr:AraC family transcriptional regulator [Cohnella terricola]TVY01239.1 helix-turn-helix domain-containing protein [Cohnella terricola]
MRKSAVWLEKGELFFHNGLNIYVNRVNERFDLPEHEHDFIEICYVWSGSGFHYIGDETIRVSQGDLFFLPVGISHIFRPSSPEAKEPLMIVNCIFDEKIFRFLTSVLPAEYGLYRFLHLVSEPGRWLHMREKAGEFCRLFDSLHAEFENKRTGFETMLVGLLLQLLIGMERTLEQGNASAEDNADSDRTDRALLYIRDRLHEKPTLACVAKHAGIGERQLQRDLTARMGLSFTALLRKERIDRSRQLLTDPFLASLTVADIASRSGLPDLKRFHRIFKETTGLTPAQYRRHYAEQTTS